MILLVLQNTASACNFTKSITVSHKKRLFQKKKIEVFYEKHRLLQYSNAIDETHIVIERLYDKLSDYSSHKG